MEQSLKIGLPDGFEHDGSNNNKLKLLYKEAMEHEDEDPEQYLNRRVEEQNNRRNNPPGTTPEDRKAFAKHLQAQMRQLLIDMQKLDTDVAVTPHSQTPEDWDSTPILMCHIILCLLDLSLSRFYLDVKKVEGGTSSFPWVSFKRVADDAGLTSYYYNDEHKLKLVGFDFGVNEQTGQYYATAVRPMLMGGANLNELDRAVKAKRVKLLSPDDVLNMTVNETNEETLSKNLGYAFLKYLELTTLVEEKLASENPSVKEEEGCPACPPIGNVFGIEDRMFVAIDGNMQLKRYKANENDKEKYLSKQYFSADEKQDLYDKETPQPATNTARSCDSSFEATAKSSHGMSMGSKVFGNLNKDYERGFCFANDVYHIPCCSTGKDIVRLTPFSFEFVNIDYGVLTL
ncbi:hypothetical protein BDB00DRAFT_787790 [Zychaea mexicana]|uniref:uncharacterized protein n=1 Tax=Zychaea mexicana TaxID=64656 RepID=UPI0022FDB7B3|nr:uncharacterized protein BDB00DRAFT_787790 [Zychaea mexicana]KAI9493686.1 hypothetical protein BDB00DRAFT_787790 [Zychaea mexicana]